MTTEASLIAQDARVAHDDAWWEAQALASEREDRRLSQRQRWLNQVPERFRDATLDEQTDPAAAQTARLLLSDLRAGRPAIVVLHGHPGAGKTHLAWAVLNAAVQEGLVQPQEVLGGKESVLVGDAASAEWAERGGLIARLLDPTHKVVFVDDVGRGHISERDRLHLWDRLVDACWEQKRMLLLTTNLRIGVPPTTASAAAYLSAWVGEAAYDRMLDGRDRWTGFADRQMRRALRASRTAAQS